jgi:hypothetical protein
MVEYIVLTIWIEYNNKIHERYKLAPAPCETAVNKVYEDYKNKQAKIVAIKCNGYKTFEINKPLMEYYRENN